MKRAITNCASGGSTLCSELVPLATPSFLRLGDRLTATAIWDLGSGAQVQPGEVGTVDYINASTGAVELLMDKRHKGLDYYDNHVALEPFDTDDILSNLTWYRPALFTFATKAAFSAA